MRKKKKGQGSNGRNKVMERLDRRVVQEARAGKFYAIDSSPIYVCVPPYEPPPHSKRDGTKVNQNSRLDESDSPELAKMKEAVVLATACFELVKTTCADPGFSAEEGLAVCEMLSDAILFHNMSFSCVVQNYTDCIVWFSHFAAQFDSPVDTASSFCHSIIEANILTVFGKIEEAVAVWDKAIGRNFETWPGGADNPNLPSARARCKVLYMRSFLKLNTRVVDLAGAKKDLDVAIETCRVQQVVGSRLIFTAQALEAGNVNKEVCAAFERDARFLVEKSHPDDRCVVHTEQWRSAKAP